LVGVQSQRAGLVDDAIKTRPVAHVAGAAVALRADLEPYGILVAVDADFLDQLQLAGGFALLPQRLRERLK
jgi:hypothetical protein